MSDDIIRLLAQAGEVTILSIALIAFCLIFGPALFKLIATLSDFLQKLADINTKLVQQVEDTRKTIEMSYTVDEQQTAAIRASTENVERSRVDMRALSGTINTSFNLADSKSDENTARILQAFEPVLLSLSEINTSMKEMQKTMQEHRGEDVNLQAQVKTMTGQLEAAEQRIVAAFREALKIAL